MQIVHKQRQKHLNLNEILKQIWKPKGRHWFVDATEFSKLFFVYKLAQKLPFSFQNSILIKFTFFFSFLIQKN